MFNQTKHDRQSLAISVATGESSLTRKFSSSLKAERTNRKECQVRRLALTLHGILTGRLS